MCRAALLVVGHLVAGGGAAGTAGAQRTPDAGVSDRAAATAIGGTGLAGVNDGRRRHFFSLERVEHFLSMSVLVPELIGRIVIHDSHAALQTKTLFILYQ